MKKLHHNIVAAFLLGLLAFVVPYWLILCLLIFCAFYFKTFWAGLLVGFEMDVLYGPGFWGGFPFIFTSIFLFVLLLTPLIKGRLSFGEHFDRQS